MIKGVNILNDIENLLFPKVCLGCNTFLTHKELTLCTLCRHQLPLTNFHLESNNQIGKIFYGRVKIEFATAFLWFEKKGIVQQLIHQLKYKKHEEVGEFIGNWMGAEIKDTKHFKDIDIVVPVPLHPKKLKKRGYNQVSAFGKHISQSIGAYYDEALLLRTFNTKTQTFKSRISRGFSDQSVFDIKDRPEYYGKHILLVDDVVTTGATIESCAKALLKLKNVRVSVATMAITA